MNRRRYAKTPKKRRNRMRIFVIRIVASALIFGAVFIVKMYAPYTAAYIENQIDYNTNLDMLAENARQLILKYTPIP